MARWSLTILFIACGLVGCGGEDSQSSRRTPGGLDQILDASKSLLALNPLKYALDPATSGSSSLVSVQRDLSLFQYDVLVEPAYDESRSKVHSVITGIGLSAIDVVGNALDIGLGIEAREYDPTTGYFGSSTRIFAAQGENLDRSQNFVILNTTTPNLLLTGLGFRLRNGRLTHLSLQRKSIGDLSMTGDAIKGNKKVVLPQGWAAVGIHVRFQRRFDPTVVDPSTVQTPFIQDALIYVGEYK